MKEWTDEELKAYYKHMSEAGYDPLYVLRKQNGTSISQESKHSSIRNH